MKRIMKIGAFIFSLFIFLCTFTMNSKIHAENEQVSWGYSATNMDTFLEKLRKERPGIDKEKDIVVAVLDTGIDSDHEWFKDKNGNSRILHEYAGNCKNSILDPESNVYICDKNADYKDIDGHGTHVSGIIAKATPDNVKILPLSGSDESICSEEDGEIDCKIGGLMEALNYLINLKVQQGVNIVALNYSVSKDMYEVSDYYLELAQLVSAAYDEGIFFVTSAGNDNEDTTNTWTRLEKAQKAIMVAAINKDMSKASFSNFGAEVDFAAPGVDIYSSVPGNLIESMQGTSMATPHVTAQIALMYAMQPTSSIQQIEEFMQKSAVDVGSYGKDVYYGIGYVDMNIAYAKLTSSSDKVIVTININGAGMINYAYGSMNGAGWRNKRASLNKIDQSISAARTSMCSYNFTKNENCMFYYFKAEQSYVQKPKWFRNTSITLELDYGTDLALFSVSPVSRTLFFKSELQNIKIDGKIPVKAPDGGYLISKVRENVMIDINYDLNFCIFGFCF